jgi:hypothetical protein
MKFVYSATTVSMKTKSTAAASAAVAPTEDESDDNTIPLPYDPETLDPLDPRRVSLDIFEVYCHEMVTTGEVRRRAFLIKKMRVSACNAFHYCGCDVGLSRSLCAAAAFCVVALL